MNMPNLRELYSTVRQRARDIAGPYTRVLSTAHYDITTDEQCYHFTFQNSNGQVSMNFKSAEYYKPGGDEKFDKQVRETLALIDPFIEGHMP